MEGAMLYRKFPAYNSNVSSAIPSDNLVRSMRSFTIPITTNFGLFSQMLKVTLETFSVRREPFLPGLVFDRCCQCRIVYEVYNRPFVFEMQEP